MIEQTEETNNQLQDMMLTWKVPDYDCMAGASFEYKDDGTMRIIMSISREDLSEEEKNTIYEEIKKEIRTLLELEE